MTQESNLMNTSNLQEAELNKIEEEMNTMTRSTALDVTLRRKPTKEVPDVTMPVKLKFRQNKDEQILTLDKSKPMRPFLKEYVSTTLNSTFDKVVFTFDGDEIDVDKTPLEVDSEIDDDELIDVVVN